MKYSYLLLFLFLFSNNALFAQIDHWETAVYASDEWQYHLGTSNPPADWKTLGFNDSDWETGIGGIGYGDNDDGTVIQPVISVFLRKKFEVVDVSKIELAFLHADYDDGFVAYLNGVEIARSFVLGFPPPFDQFAYELHEATLYEGGLPEGFKLEKDLLDQIPLQTENVLAVQVHNFDGLSSSDLSSNFFLSFGINDTSNDYGPTPDWFIDPSFSSHLPILKINSFGEYIPDDPSIPAEMGIVWNGAGAMNNSLDQPNEFFGNMAIERRGQSSLGLFPKNGFAIETKDSLGEDMDVAFLNFPEEEDWLLHGPYSDKSLMRNVLTMHISEQMGQYASHTRFVELVINDEYEGIYVLMEKIKQDKNRVDIADLKEEDISGDELTGGYVFKVDKDEADWYSQYDVEAAPGTKLPFQYVSPKKSKIQPVQEQYIQSYVDSFERAVRSSNWVYAGKRYDEYIDLPSFADNFIINELSKNIDAFRLSSYFYKDKDSKDGKIHAGPVWDFNLSFGNADYCNGWNPTGWVRDTPCGNTNPFWWERMIQDPVFANLVKCRWMELREGPLHVDSLMTFIDGQSNYLEPALDRNFQRWPVLGIYIWPNPVILDTYEEEIDFMKNFLKDRIAWMDNNIFGECTAVSTSSQNASFTFSIAPNPSSSKVVLKFNNEINKSVSSCLSNVYGKKIKEWTWLNTHQKEIDLNGLPNGIYWISVKKEGQIWSKKVVLMR